jgi:FkbM family methyltransferase
MPKYFLKSLIFYSMCSSIACEPKAYWEGIWGSAVHTIDNMNQHFVFFSRYNPTIIEVGSFEGNGTIQLSKSYPYGTIFSFEPHPHSFEKLQEKTKNLKNVIPINLAVYNINGEGRLCGNGCSATLFQKERKTDRDYTVSCVRLEDWCNENKIDQIDFLRLDTNGLEFLILSDSTQILQKTISISVKTFSHPIYYPIARFSKIKSLLTNAGFEMMTHWYVIDKTKNLNQKKGEAFFVKKHLYDSIFR